jgi:hypothetical protein
MSANGRLSGVTSGPSAHRIAPGTPVRIALREKANPFGHKRKRPS